MPMRSRLFISHISEEKEFAAQLKTVLTRDFLGLDEVFVSSDTESIGAGEEWLQSVATALRECAIVVILCSPDSVRRPWINFEAGAAWMRDIPIVPVCHQGLVPRDLPVPLSLRQGIALDSPEDLNRLYKKVAEVIQCQIPDRDFAALSRELATATPQLAMAVGPEIGHAREIRGRLKDSLEALKFEWRSLERVAMEAAVSEERAADLLRSDPEVRFSKGQSGNIIVGLRSRVGS
jgi:TIR domain